MICISVTYQLLFHMRSIQEMYHGLLPQDETRREGGHDRRLIKARCQTYMTSDRSNIKSEIQNNESTKVKLMYFIMK